MKRKPKPAIWYWSLPPDDPRFNPAWQARSNELNALIAKSNPLFKAIRANNTRLEAFWAQIDYEQYYRSQVPE